MTWRARSRGGSDVTRFTVGDEVYGRPRDGRVGTFAQRLAVHEDDLARRPGRFDGRGRVGSSGRADRLAGARGARERAARSEGADPRRLGGCRHVRDPAGQAPGATVATTTGTTNVRWVKDLVADVVIDYKTKRSRRNCRATTSSGLTGRRHARASLTVLKPGGLAIGIAGPPDPAFATQLGRRFPLAAGDGAAQPQDPLGRQAPRRPLLVPVHARRRRAARADRGADRAGTLRPVIDRTFPLTGRDALS